MCGEGKKSWHVWQLKRLFLLCWITTHRQTSRFNCTTPFFQKLLNGASKKEKKICHCFWPKKIAAATPPLQMPLCKRASSAKKRLWFYWKVGKKGANFWLCPRSKGNKWLLFPHLKRQTRKSIGSQGQTSFFFKIVESKKKKKKAIIKKHLSKKW